MGTILGGSSIVKPLKGKNCYLFMRSCNKIWLTYKAIELNDFASRNPFTKETSTNRWHSSCWPIFNNFREMFYKGGHKVITAESLDPLKDIGLAIWYGDNGRLEKDMVVLNTHSFGLKSSNTVVDYLQSCGIESEIWMQKDKYRVRLSADGTLKFLKTIAHRMPTFMHHKFSSSQAEEASSSQSIK